MPLASGTRLGPYEVLSAIGAGGMGEVYRARDTELRRDVALKILPSEFALDPDRLARFDREAQALAALNHPHIAQVYGLAHEREVRAIVMELVEGPTLADRIARAPLPLDEALVLAMQLADALEYAHERGILHRDLKPANVKLTIDGAVKVLDFGLAKILAFDETDPVVDPLGDSPTMRSPALSRAGVILGTAAYMAPEQARGAAVDKRADVWAFGVILFEMLTGRVCFAGETVTDILAAVVKTDPDWAALPAGTPPRLRELLARCLAKDRKERLRDIGDARLDVAAIRQPQGREPGPAGGPVSWRRLASIGSVLFFLAATAGSLLTAYLTHGPAQLPVHALIDAAPADEVDTGSTLDMLPAGANTALAWSPDGRTLAFIGVKDNVRLVYLRDTARDSANPLDGTHGATSLAFSPDGRWMAFWNGSEIRKVRLEGGPTAKLCDAPTTVSGLVWGARGLVYAQARQILEVPPEGGTPRILADPGRRVASPHLLPDGSALLYTDHQKLWTSGDERVMVLPLAPAGAAKVLLPNAADARYLPTGHLAFLRQGTLYLAPFDAQTLTFTGGEVAVIKDVAQSMASWYAGDLTLAGQWAVSPRGSLAYVASPSLSFPVFELVTIDRNGRITPLTAPAATYREHIEPDPRGSRFIVSVQTATNVRLFLYDRDTLTPLLAESGVTEAVRPVWSSDGRIACNLIREGISQLASLDLATGSEPQLVADSQGFSPSGSSPEGRIVGVREGDIWAYAPDGTGPRFRPLLQTGSVERYPAWSPDGRWLAYSSNASGAEEVYVRPFPGPGAATRLSTNSGRSPAWNPKGGELFYAEPPAPGGREWRMMTVNMTNPLQPGRPTAMFSFQSENLPLASCSPQNCYSVMPDGRGFVGQRMLPRARRPVTNINLIENWFEELKAKAPPAR